jgi:hypothetical protein
MDLKRFNNPKYKKQISAVRGYKRQARSLPEGRFQKFLHLIKMGNWVTQLAIVFVLAALIYLVYFAPFLRVLNVRITGANDSVAPKIQSQFDEYIKQSRWKVFPQRNIVLFSSGNFADYILKNNVEVAEIRSVKKDIDGSVAVNVLQRVPALIYQSSGRDYVLNTDGNLGTEIGGIEKVCAPGSVSCFISDLSSKDLSPGQVIFSPDRVDSITYIRDNFQPKFNVAIDHFEMSSSDSESVTILTKNNFSIYLNVSKSSEENLQKLFTLWNNLSPDQQKKLYYIDMRFSPNAYVCLKGDQCSVSPEIIEQPKEEPKQ